jgi:hypothetical protein
MRAVRVECHSRQLGVAVLHASHGKNLRHRAVGCDDPYVDLLGRDVLADEYLS